MVGSLFALVGWLVGWLVCRFVGLFVGWLVVVVVVGGGVVVAVGGGGVIADVVVVVGVVVADVVVTVVVVGAVVVDVDVVVVDVFSLLRSPLLVGIVGHVRLLLVVFPFQSFDVHLLVAQESILELYCGYTTDPVSRFTSPAVF